jgi:class 3 adenylate cyclase
MKRITYVSTSTSPPSPDTLDEIARVSVRNNARAHVTGILLSGGEFFLQILEGEAVEVDRVLERIRKDPRHGDLQLIKVENSASDRLFPDWSMQAVRLDDMNDALIQAIRIILANMTESRRILERYTQPAVLEFINQGINPLQVPYQTGDKVVLFGDIAAFDALSAFYTTEEVAEHARCFLEVVSAAVVRHGGQVNKYMGDKVMAYFPTSRVDDAIRSCLETLQAIRALRANAAQCRLRNFLYGGFGLTLGPVIEGNFGTPLKLDYTILGHTANMAARLESMTRSTGRALMFGESVKDACQEPWPWEAMGQFQLKGESAACSYYSLKEDLVLDTRSVDDMINHVLSTTEEHRRNCPC